jgi:MFS transporter, VNT family, synaptic vesicle glycoprotein 2
MLINEQFQIKFKYFIGMLFGGYLYGTLADLSGRKWTLINALVFNGIASVCAGLSQTYTWLLIFRFLSGVG